MIEVSEQHLVDAEKVRELQERAEILMKDPDCYESGCVIKWTLEELGLWEEQRLTDRQVLEYVRLVDRKLELGMMPMCLWKPEHTKELERIDQRLQELRPLVDAAHRSRKMP